MLAEGNGLTANAREWTRIRRKIHHRDTEYTEAFDNFVERSYSVVSVSLWCKFGFHSRQFAVKKVVSTDALRVVKLLL
jgi:hypothetical protein